jgi:hypothetical protein
MTLQELVFDLLSKHFFLRCLEIFQELVGVNADRLQDFIECLKANQAIGFVARQLYCLRERLIRHLLAICVETQVDENPNVLAPFFQQVQDCLGFAVNGKLSLVEVYLMFVIALLLMALFLLFDSSGRHDILQKVKRRT